MQRTIAWESAEIQGIGEPTLGGKVRTRRAVFVLCLVPAAYFFATAAYALLDFADYAADTPRLVRYVVVPTVLAMAFFAAALLLPLRTGLAVGVNAIAVLLALFLFEGFLTFEKLSADRGLVGHTKDGDGPGTRVARGLPPAYTLKALNNEIGVERLEQALLGGLPDEDVLLCTRDGVPVFYRADRYGFNNPDSVHAVPVQLLVLGDSFVEGICLTPGDDVAGRLREAIPQTIGTGTRGAGPLFELAVLGRFGPVLEPRVTVMAFFAGNDWENLEKEADVPWLRDALSDDAEFGNPIPATDTLARAEKVIAGWWDGSTRDLREVLRRKALLRNFVALAQTALQLGLHYPKATPDQPIFEEILVRAKTLTASWGGEFAVAYVPPIDRFVGLLDNRFVYDQLRDLVHDAANKAGVDVIDLADVFDRHEEPLGLYAPDSHFSEAGAALAARTIAAYAQGLPVLDARPTR